MSVYSQKTITPPKEQAIHIVLAKQFLHIDGNDEDGVLDVLIGAAVKKFEAYTGIAIMQRILQVVYVNDYCDNRLDDISNIILPLSPIAQILCIEFCVQDDVWNEVKREAWDVRNNALHVPYAQSYHQKFRITYSAGIAETQSGVPEDIKFAILHAVCYLYENRGDCTNLVAAKTDYLKNLYDQFRVTKLG